MKHCLLPLLLATLSGCSWFTTEVRTNIQISAPKKIVWDILTNFDSYPQWNPYHVKALRLTEDSIPHSPKLDDELQVFIHKPNGKKLDLEVSILKLIEQKELYWGGGIPLIFKGEHRFILHSEGKCATRLHHDEDFWGLALPLIPLGPEFIEQGYQEMNEALKKRAEELVEAQENPLCSQ